MWVGDADRGFGAKQPGGWIYNILPYVEQQALHDLGRGKSAADKRADANKVIVSPIAGFHCPSRRRPKLYPDYNGGAHGYNYDRQAGGVARSDYAINAGHVVSTYGGPASLAQGDSMTWPDTTTPTSGSFGSGVSYLRSEVAMADIRDGTSSTYLVGEKYLNTDSYDDGTDGADNTSMYQGYDWDVNRWAHATNALPNQDTKGVPNTNSFGGPHAGAFLMSFCDGSVRGIAYDINGTTHQNLAHRKDGQVIDSSQL